MVGEGVDVDVVAEIWSARVERETEEFGDCLPPGERGSGDQVGDVAARELALDELEARSDFELKWWKNAPLELDDSAITWSSEVAL